jgi:hypothetical protein
MNNSKSRTSFLLLPVGLLIMSSTFFIRRFTEVTDFTDGALKGMGLGLILLALILPKIQSRICRSNF